jgi:hypothetical protein
MKMNKKRVQGSNFSQLHLTQMTDIHNQIVQPPSLLFLSHYPAEYKIVGNYLTLFYPLIVTALVAVLKQTLYQAFSLTVR